MSKSNKSIPESTNEDHDDEVVYEDKIGEVRLHFIAILVFLFLIGICQGDWVAAIIAIAASCSSAVMIRVVGYYTSRGEKATNQDATGLAHESKHLKHDYLQQPGEPGKEKVKVQDIDDDFSCLV